MSKVSIIIPVFNQWSYTQKCLESIAANTPADIFSIVVFDNASTDETAISLTELKSNYPFMTIKRSEINLGFSPACNLAAQGCDSEFLLFLNNDTLASPSWIDPLLTAFQEAKVGISGPKLVYPQSQRINHAGYVYNHRFGSFYPIYHNESENHQAATQSRDYQALLGACMLIPNSLFKAVGGFWEYGLEDIDLCMKVREHGKLVRYVPDSKVYHAGSVTLRFSAKGSYPETSSRQFKERWLSGQARWDDYFWYAKDGARPWPAGLNAQAGENALEHSYQFTTEGINLHRQGDLSSAEEKLKLALDYWAVNPDALSELMVIQLEFSKLPAALQIARKIANQIEFSALALIEAAQVIAACGYKEEAHSIFAKVLADPGLNLDLKTYAQSIQSNLFSQATVG